MKRYHKGAVAKHPKKILSPAKGVSHNLFGAQILYDGEIQPSLAGSDIHGQFTAYTLDDVPDLEHQHEVIAADPNVRNHSYICCAIYFIYYNT